VTSAHSRAFTSFRKPRVSSGPAKLHTPTCARLWRASRPSSHTGHLFLKIRVCRYRSSLAIATDSAGASDLRLHLPSQRPKRAMRLMNDVIVCLRPYIVPCPPAGKPTDQTARDASHKRSDRPKYRADGCASSSHGPRATCSDSKGSDLASSRSRLLAFRGRGNVIHRESHSDRHKSGSDSASVLGQRIDTAARASGRESAGAARCLISNRRYTLRDAGLRGSCIYPRPCTYRAPLPLLCEGTFCARNIGCSHIRITP